MAPRMKMPAASSNSPGPSHTPTITVTSPSQSMSEPDGTHLTRPSLPKIIHNPSEQHVSSQDSQTSSSTVVEARFTDWEHPPHFGHPHQNSYGVKEKPSPWMNKFCVEPPDDASTCCEGFWLPSISYGRTHARLKRMSRAEDPLDESNFKVCNGPCWLFATLELCSCSSFMLAFLDRLRIRATYNIEGSCFGDFVASLCCTSCTLMQHDREVRAREAPIQDVTTSHLPEMQYISPQPMSASPLLNSPNSETGQPGVRDLSSGQTDIKGKQRRKLQKSRAKLSKVTVEVPVSDVPRHDVKKAVAFMPVDAIQAVGRASARPNWRDSIAVTRDREFRKHHADIRNAIISAPIRRRDSDTSTLYGPAKSSTDHETSPTASGEKILVAKSGFEIIEAPHPIHPSRQVIARLSDAEIDSACCTESLSEGSPSRKMVRWEVHLVHRSDESTDDNVLSGSTTPVCLETDSLLTDVRRDRDERISGASNSLDESIEDGSQQRQSASNALDDGRSPSSSDDTSFESQSNSHNEKPPNSDTNHTALTSTPGSTSTGDKAIAEDKRTEGTDLEPEDDGPDNSPPRPAQPTLPHRESRTSFKSGTPHRLSIASNNGSLTIRVGTKDHGLAQSQRASSEAGLIGTLSRTPDNTAQNALKQCIAIVSSDSPKKSKGHEPDHRASDSGLAQSKASTKGNDEDQTVILVDGELHERFESGE